MSWVAVGMTVFGAVKSEAIDKPKEKRQRELAAKTQELSPWTGMKAGAIQEADTLGTAMQYGATGLSMDRQMKYDEAMEQALKRGEYGSVLKSDGGWSNVQTPNFGLQTTGGFSPDEINKYGKRGY